MKIGIFDTDKMSPEELKEFYENVMPLLELEDEEVSFTISKEEAEKYEYKHADYLFPDTYLARIKYGPNRPAFEGEEDFE